MRRLVSRAILRLAAFTPTDASHVLGDQTTHDPEIAGWVRRVRPPSRSIRQRHRRDARGDQRRRRAALVRRSARRCSQLRLTATASMTPSLSLRSSLLRSIARLALRIDIGLGAKLVGLGAPAATYYPLIGELLGTEVEVPADADVANAIGAVVGKVRVRAEVPVTAARRGVYRIHAGGEPETTWEHPEAQARAEELARAAVVEVQAAGAKEFEVEVTWSEKVIEVDGRPLFVEGMAIAVAAGRPDLG